MTSRAGPGAARFATVAVVLLAVPVACLVGLLVGTVVAAGSPDPETPSPVRLVGPADRPADEGLETVTPEPEPQSPPVPGQIIRPTTPPPSPPAPPDEEPDGEEDGARGSRGGGEGDGGEGDGGEGEGGEGD